MLSQHIYNSCKSKYFHISEFETETHGKVVSFANITKESTNVRQTIMQWNWIHFIQSLCFLFLVLSPGFSEVSCIFSIFRCGSLPWFVHEESLEKAPALGAWFSADGVVGELVRSFLGSSMESAADGALRGWGFIRGSWLLGAWLWRV